MAWYSNCSSVLRRWSALTEKPLPDKGFASFADKFCTESFQIRLADPELVSILDGTCNAGLKADVLGGKWDSASPTEEQQLEAKRQAELQQLFDAKPVAEGSQNLTLQMQMRALNPQLTAQVEQEALANSTRAPHAEKERLQETAAQVEARHRSLIKGMNTAQGEQARRVFR